MTKIADDPNPSNHISRGRRAGRCCNGNAVVQSRLGPGRDARQAVADPLNRDGFYRFKIGAFQATVISDGYGPIPAVDPRYERH